MNPIQILWLCDVLLAVVTLVLLARTRGLPRYPSRLALILQIVLIPYVGSICFLLSLRRLKKYRLARESFSTRPIP